MAQQNPVTELRDRIAKQAAIAEYLALYEHHCEQEQVLVALGQYDDSQVHHQAAVLVLWSMDAEQQDPQPPGLARA